MSFDEGLFQHNLVFDLCIYVKDVWAVELTEIFSIFIDHWSSLDMLVQVDGSILCPAVVNAHIIFLHKITEFKNFYISIQTTSSIYLELMMMLKSESYRKSFEEDELKVFDINPRKYGNI